MEGKEPHRNEVVFDRRESLRAQDAKIRKDLSGRLESDPKYFELCRVAHGTAESIVKYLKDAGNSFEEGVDRARSLAAARSQLEKLREAVERLRETERGIASDAFREVDELRQAAERDAEGPLTKI